jgi:ligand-binding sensor domain-containing protein
MIKKNYINSKTVFFWLLVIWPLFINAEESTEITYRISPFIRNFYKSDYGGANQNWSVTQDNKGFFYFGNTFGLLEFNGNNWRLYPSRGNTPIRTVFADSDGKIYYGTYEDFGYYVRDEFGVLQQSSLKENLSDTVDIRQNTIWTIKRINNHIYFHSFRKLFVKVEDEIREIVSRGPVFSFFEYNQKPYFYLLNKGLYFLNNNFEIIKEELPEYLHLSRIKKMLSLSDHSELIVTEFSGLFIKKGKSCDSWDCMANKILKNTHINKAIRINDERIAIGTISHGLFIINNEGEIIFHLDKSNGLQDNTILSLLVDSTKNLWVGMDKGIDFIELNSPYTFCSDRLGILGSVYCSAVYKNKLYVGTNHGLFYSDWDFERTSEQIEFKQFPELKGQVWNLEILNDKLLCSFNTGTLQIEGDQLKWLSNLGGYQFIKDPFDNSLFYQGTYMGISRFKQNKDGDFYLLGPLSLTLGGIKSLQYDFMGNLWCGTEFNGLLKIQLNEMKDSIISKRVFGKESGFQDYWNVGVFKLDNRIVFSQDSTFYTYDYIIEKVIPYTWLNAKLGKYVESHHISKTGDHEYWFGKNNQLGKFYCLGDSLSLITEIKYSSIHASAVDNKENIRKITDRFYLLGLDNGFAIYDTQSSSGQKDWLKEKIVLNSAICSNLSGSILNLKITPNSNIEIPFRFRRNIIFNFSIPGKIRESYTLQYKLDDNDTWSTITPDYLIKFNYLDFGTHHLSLIAEDKSSQYRNSSMQLSFKILPPWYQHQLAFIAYFILLIGFIYILTLFNKIHLKKQKLAYQNKIKAEHLQNIQLIKRQSLEKEVENKSKELVNYTILLSKKNEVLQKLLEILKKDESPDDKTNKQVKQIINQNLGDRNDWQIFRSHFDEAHSDFLKKLKAMHSNLTPNDLRFCAFLRMNMASKEISILLNMSLRSIEVKDTEYDISWE